MLPDNERSRPASGETPGGPIDHAASGSTSIVEPDSIAVARIRRALALVVWTHDGHRSHPRTLHTTSAAQRAVERAQQRGHLVSVVLVRLTPIHTGFDPLQLVIDEDGGE